MAVVRLVGVGGGELSILGEICQEKGTKGFWRGVWLGDPRPPRACAGAGLILVREKKCLKDIRYSENLNIKCIKFDTNGFFLDFLLSIGVFCGVCPSLCWRVVTPAWLLGSSVARGIFFSCRVLFFPFFSQNFLL